MGWDGITPLRLRQLLLQLLKELNVGKHITSLLELQVICPSSGRLNPSNAIWVTIGALFEIVLTKKLKWFFVRKVLISVMNMSANAVYIQIWHQSYPAQDIFLSPLYQIAITLFNLILADPTFASVQYFPPRLDCNRQIWSSAVISCI